MSELTPLLAIVAVIAVAAIALRGGGRESGEKAPPAPVRMTVHGPSSLAGGYIENQKVRFYVPSPVQLLRELMPAVDLVDCTQNGLALTEALAGGPVRLDNPALGGTRGTCEALADIWRRERPRWAYVALIEVEPLFWPEFTPERLLGQLQQLHRQAQACGVRLVLQGPIHFASQGPWVSGGLTKLAAADYTAACWAKEAGVPYITLANVPFDPTQDVCPDGLHPTQAMHERYALARADQLRSVLA